MHAKAIPRGLRGWVCVLFLAASSALAGMPPDPCDKEEASAARPVAAQVEQAPPLVRSCPPVQPDQAAVTIHPAQAQPADESGRSWIGSLIAQGQILGGVMAGNPESMVRLAEIWLAWSPAADWLVGIGLALVLLPLLVQMIDRLLRPVFKGLFRLWLRPGGKEKRLVQQSGSPELLSSQKAVVDRLLQEADRLDAGQPGRMVGLHAPWGGGKSFVMQSLRARVAQQEGQVVAVVVNIWENQRAQDLHLALVRAVLEHPSVFADLSGRYPRRLLLAPLVGMLSRVLPNGLEVALGGSQAALKAGLSIPMIWQPSFQRFVRLAVNRGWRFIIVLDEIDRADPPMAQAAMTVARRALDLPGILVVMPYVEEQIRHKVFTPHNVVSPDLLGTQEAIMEALPFNDEDKRLWQARLESLFPQEGGKEARLSSEQFREQRRLFQHERFLRYTSDPQWHALLFHRMSEKFLAWSVVLDGARGRDLVDFLFARGTVFHTQWRGIVKEEHREALEKALTRLCESGLRLGGDDPIEILPPNFTVNALRRFEGLLDEWLARDKDGLVDLAEIDPAAANARLLSIVVLVCLRTRQEIKNDRD